MLLDKSSEKSSCGVGFIVNREQVASHELLQQALKALSCVEHRGACAADNLTGDGAGIMTDIPFELFGYKPGTVAVATLFMPTHRERLRLAMRVFEETLGFMGLKVLEYRDVPVDRSVLGSEALSSLPTITHAFIERPAYCRTDESFNRLLYASKQTTRTKERESGIVKEFFFTSLSTTTLVYKGLTRAQDLQRFYLDLQNPTFKTRFALFHRRFSTNTRTSWDKAQPFRLIGHNGEINTIAGNRSWAYSREQSLGLPVDELLTHEGISDSGSLNEMVEALKYRSSIPRVEDILAIMMPPADQQNGFYKFWSRAMEPWDGPALITYSDGETIGARLDRNGFRPCRWTMTADHFYLCSEAGSFPVDESTVIGKGTLHAGSGVTVDISTGLVHFEDPSRSRENHDARFDPRLLTIDFEQHISGAHSLEKKHLFSYTQEDFEKILVPMITEGKEAIGSMGDTARPAFLSTEPRSFFDYFYQDFAQVTNPPLDYLRESMVTDLVTHLGRRPNIFAPKELIPPVAGIELKGPVLSLSQMAYFHRLPEGDTASSRLIAHELSMTFNRAHGVVGFRSALARLAQEACDAVEKGAAILIITDRHADIDNPPIPSLLVLRALVNALNREGIRLHASIVVDSAEIRSTHHVAALIGFGATAVCPYLALEIARFDPHPDLKGLEPEVKERNLVQALQSGLLKIMSKMGISVVRSYQSSRLFTVLGLGAEIMQEFLPGRIPAIGGIGYEQLVEDILRQTSIAAEKSSSDRLINTYQYKEHNKGTVGEKHSMTNTRSKLIHRIVRETGLSLDNPELYAEYLRTGEGDAPVSIRHLLELKTAGVPLPREAVQDLDSILRTFGSGAMSFGAISAESQRDIFKAMRQIGGRSNSGEGGENPYYFIDGTTASIKQVASGRFGVTAEYLASAQEFQIKIAQGAKPGEGGQLMGVKVNPDIARARHSNPNVDLISPPPLHDIYSIEDLKQLIFELKQFNPDATVNVKLVSGANIGTIAVGVVKAGADVIHISGHDGGTGAASLSSMKHAGLPWELGLVEVNHALVTNDLRRHVKIRVDGGMHSGTDLVIAAIFGADQFEFGKLLLVSQGCVMARICEKNTCPTGIATHDPKFKAKYKGTPEDTVRVLTVLGNDVRRILAQVGVASLEELKGRKDLLAVSPRHAEFVQARKLDMNRLLDAVVTQSGREERLFIDGVSDLNEKIVADYQAASGETFTAEYPVTTSDRAVLATLSGNLAKVVVRQRAERMLSLSGSQDTFYEEFVPPKSIDLTFHGSAGQGFGVFLGSNMRVVLQGEANDSVCKSMSSGKVIITPSDRVTYDPSRNSIIGNCALYGATGGTLYVNGLAGDRFAVRNSGAVAVVEGTGLHACEYMTNGTVVILGSTSHNIGAGMTGGTLYVLADNAELMNRSYITPCGITDDDSRFLKELLSDYAHETRSQTAIRFLESWEDSVKLFVKALPRNVAKEQETVATQAA